MLHARNPERHLHVGGRVVNFGPVNGAPNVSDAGRGRRFGDIALIHAENAYERKDRRRGVNRYTDIWRKQADGRWLCIAAHITTHKAPV